MIAFFKPWDWRLHRASRTERIRRAVNEARIKECQRLLQEQWTDEDREKAVVATRAYLASVEQGC